MALEHEVEVFRDHLIDLLGGDDVNEGRYAVVKGDEIRGPFEDYEEALGEGYRRYGLTPFLVKKIERNESIMYFARDLK